MPKNIWVAAGDGDLDRVRVSLLLFQLPTPSMNIQELLEHKCKLVYTAQHSYQ